MNSNKPAEKITEPILILFKSNSNKYYYFSSYNQAHNFYVMGGSSFIINRSQTVNIPYTWHSSYGEEIQVLDVQEINTIEKIHTDNHISGYKVDGTEYSIDGLNQLLDSLHVSIINDQYICDSIENAEKYSHIQSTKETLYETTYTYTNIVFEIHDIPSDADCPEFITPTYHNNLSSFDIFKFNTLEFAKKYCAIVAKKYQYKFNEHSKCGEKEYTYPEHSGLRFLQINGSYCECGKQLEYTGQYAGTMVEINKYKNSIKNALDNAFYLADLRLNNVNLTNSQVVHILDTVNKMISLHSTIESKQKSIHEYRVLGNMLTDMKHELSAEHQ